jgi:hypothetical protein
MQNFRVRVDLTSLNGNKFFGGQMKNPPQVQGAIGACGAIQSYAKT